MASTVTELLRRRFGGKKGILPSGYTQLNYIENQSGKNSCFSVSQSLGFRVAFEFAPNLQSMGIYSCMFGANRNFQAAFQSTGKAYMGNAASNGVFFIDGVKAAVECGISTTSTSSYYYVDNADTGLRRGSTATTWYFFAATETGQFPARGKMYSFKMWNSNNELIMNLIPCKDPNNICGMYDIVNNVFYSSTTSDPFIGG